MVQNVCADEIELSNDITETKIVNNISSCSCSLQSPEVIYFSSVFWKSQDLPESVLKRCYQLKIVPISSSGAISLILTRLLIPTFYIFTCKLARASESLCASNILLIYLKVLAATYQGSYSCS